MLQKELQERVNGGITDPGSWQWMRILSAICRRSKMSFVFVPQPARQVTSSSLDHYTGLDTHNSKHLQGEVPNNMKTFWKFLLRKSLPVDSLKGILVAVFGLGDSGELYLLSTTTSFQGS